MGTTEVVEKTETALKPTFGKAITYFKKLFSSANRNLIRVYWELGRTGNAIKNEAVYGDKSVEDFSEALGKGKSSVYDCIQLYNMYDWDIIEAKFLASGVPASSIARLSTISDEGARRHCEDKVISGDIGHDQILPEKKVYEKTLEGDDPMPAEPTIEEKGRTTELGETDPNVIAHNKIRRDFAKALTLSDKLCKVLDDCIDTSDNLSDIADPALYEAAKARIEEALTAIRYTQQYCNNTGDLFGRLVGEIKEE